MKIQAISAALLFIVSTGAWTKSPALAAQSASEGAVERAAAARRGPQLFVLDHGILREVSGLASSTRNRAWVWAHEDSGNAAALIAISPERRAVLRYRLRGARNFD